MENTIQTKLAEYKEHIETLKSIDELEDLWKTDRVFEPSNKNVKANDDYGRWLEMIKKEIN